jgi:hypothetical protein
MNTTTIIDHAGTFGQSTNNQHVSSSVGVSRMHGMYTSSVSGHQQLPKVPLTPRSSTGSTDSPQQVKHSVRIHDARSLQNMEKLHQYYDELREVSKQRDTLLAHKADMQQQLRELQGRFMVCIRRSHFVGTCGCTESTTPNIPTKHAAQRHLLHAAHTWLCRVTPA